MKGKTYKVDLLPEDFGNPDFTDACDCALIRATKRHFNCKDKHLSCCETLLSIYDDIQRNFKVVNGFDYEDWLYVGEKYKDPNHDTVYYVTLKEI